jgi:hypothetical protein
MNNAITVKGPYFFVHSFILVGTCDLHTQCEGGEIGEEVRSVGKVTRETKGIPSSSVNYYYFLFP